MTLATLLAVIVSLPEPVTTFSMPHSVSLPDCELEALPLPWRSLPRSTVILAVIAAHVERVAASVAIVGVVAIALLGNDPIIAASGLHGVVAAQCLDRLASGGAGQRLALRGADQVRCGGCVAATCSVGTSPVKVTECVGAGQRLGAVAVVGEIVVGRVRSRRHLDDILRPQRADNRVGAAIRAEDDAVGGGQGRDVDRVVARLAIDGDGVEPQAGAGEVADDLERVAARACPTPPDRSR